MKTNFELKSFTRILPKTIVRVQTSINNKAKTVFETGFYTGDNTHPSVYVQQRFLRPASEGIYTGEVVLKYFKSYILVEKSVAILMTTLYDYLGNIKNYNK